GSGKTTWDPLSSSASTATPCFRSEISGFQQPGTPQIQKVYGAMDPLLAYTLAHSHLSAFAIPRGSGKTTWDPLSSSASTATPCFRSEISGFQQPGTPQIQKVYGAMDPLLAYTLAHSHLSSHRSAFAISRGSGKTTWMVLHSNTPTPCFRSEISGFQIFPQSAPSLRNLADRAEHRAPLSLTPQCLLDPPSPIPSSSGDPYGPSYLQIGSLGKCLSIGHAAGAQNVEHPRGDHLAVGNLYLGARGTQSMTQIWLSCGGRQDVNQTGFQLATAHDLLGWKNFVDGRIHKKFVEIQEEYIVSRPSNQQRIWKSSAKWAAGLVDMIIRISTDNGSIGTKNYTSNNGRNPHLTNTSKLKISTLWPHGWNATRRQIWTAEFEASLAARRAHTLKRKRRHDRLGLVSLNHDGRRKKRREKGKTRNGDKPQDTSRPREIRHLA
ncbi:hypothetical protein THAOC_14668, partial [Thalassiosira oceanica]